MTSVPGRWLAVAAAALLLIGCGGKGAKEIRIGVFGSLTGPTATFGQSMKDGALLAIEEINSRGGVLGRQLRPIIEDDQSRPENARNAATKLINRDHVAVLLGEVASTRSLAAAPVAQENHVPMISPASTNPGVTQRGDYIFRVCFIDPWQGEVMARFCLDHLHKRRVAILTDVRNDYSVGLARYFKQTLEKRGGKVVAEESYSEGDKDYVVLLGAIKRANPEAVFIPGYYGDVALICRQARQQGINVPLLGGDGWDAPELVQIGGQAVEGAYFSNHYVPDDPTPAVRQRVRQFIAAYQAKYGEIPDAMAVLGYDAAGVMADAIKRAGKLSGPAIRDALAATKDFPGVSGKITINRERNAVKRAVVVTIRNGQQAYVASYEPTSVEH